MRSLIGHGGRESEAHGQEPCGDDGTGLHPRRIRNKQTRHSGRHERHPETREYGKKREHGALRGAAFRGTHEREEERGQPVKEGGLVGLQSLVGEGERPLVQDGSDVGEMGGGVKARVRGDADDLSEEEPGPEENDERERDPGSLRPGARSIAQREEEDYAAGPECQEPERVLANPRKGCGQGSTVGKARPIVRDRCACQRLALPRREPAFVRYDRLDRSIDAKLQETHAVGIADVGAQDVLTGHEERCDIDRGRLLPMLCVTSTERDLVSIHLQDEIAHRTHMEHDRTLGPIHQEMPLEEAGTRVALIEPQGPCLRGNRRPDPGCCIGREEGDLG